jgi:hypothetical protein
MATFGNYTTSPNNPPDTPIPVGMTGVGPTGGLVPEGDHMEPTIGQIWPR